MNEDIKRKAERTGREALNARPDPELARRLEHLDSTTWPITLRLSASESHSFTVKGIALARARDPGDSELQHAFTQGYLYGFQLGHDYALKYGRLGTESE